MSSDDDDRFRVRPAPPRASRQIAKPRFISRVIETADRRGSPIKGTKRRRPGRGLGRGAVAARFAGRGLGRAAQRVVIKTRLVNHAKSGIKAVRTHLRYIERDGTGPNGERGCAYGRDADTVDVQKFAERVEADRHHFRFIVTAEEGAELGDLRGFTRSLMVQMERDLGTRLTWVAVDHWNTDNPHTHVMLRGKDAEGRDLIIAPEYIAQGMRMRAMELATQWLGPRTEKSIADSLLRDVEQQRWTDLDRSLKRIAHEGVVVLSGASRDDDERLLHARLGRLSSLGLATEQGSGTWVLHPQAEATLRALGERGDIVRTMQRAMSGAAREISILDGRGAAQEQAPIVGRVVSKGLADELTDRGYVVVDGIDGRAHYVPLPMHVDLADLPVGGIVEVRSAPSARQVDRTIAELARDGLYRTDQHRAALQAAPSEARAAGQRKTAHDEIVLAHERRLEALRRAGHVERLGEGVWRIPANFLDRARGYDKQQAGGLSVELRSARPIEQQTRAIGATWLDRQLVAGEASFAPGGFGAEARSALEARREFLVEEGFATRRGQRVVLMRDLLTTLRNRELNDAAQAIERETGLPYRSPSDGARVSGIYRRSVWLASGRFALLDDGAGFSLVPWRPVIEQRLGQQIAGTIRGGSVSWDLARTRGRGV